MEHTATQSEETLLRAWLQMTACIRGNRFLSHFSFNESFICNLLVQRQESGAPPLTATELCEETRLLKSQMNHILTGMEKKGLILREKSSADQRSMQIRLRQDALSLYEREHAQILRLIGALRDQMGPADAEALAALMERAVSIINTLKRSDNTP